MKFSFSLPTKNYFLIIPTIFLAGCQTVGNEGASQRTQVAAVQTQATIAPNIPVSGFRCPPAGTTLTYSDGSTIRYEGTDQNDPLVCILTTNRGTQRRIFNFYTLPVEDESSIRRGFSAIWPLEPGKTTSFTFISRSSRDPTRTFRYRDTWRVERAERVMLAGEQRNVLVLTRTQEGMFDNNFMGTETYQYDPQIGVFLSRTVQVQRGISSSPPFEVTRVELRR